MDIRPDYANIEVDGKLEQVDPDEVEAGTVIVVQPGEKVPIDGIIEEGNTTLNTSALTGESLPRQAKAGDEVISGCINMSGVLKIRTTKEFGESTVSKILDLVENASSKKSRSELYQQICKDIYTSSLLRCAGTCYNSTTCKHDILRSISSVGNVDIQSAYIFSNKLSLCTCHKYSAQLLCRNRWSK
jgi:P-type E1-E2 ATPase